MSDDQHTPPQSDPDATQESAGRDAVIGSQIGPYKLLDLIAEGGMGAVYLARQDSPVKRRVAIKLIKSGMDSKQVIARFEAERQALALMEHPSIAKFYETGTVPAGNPYFAMEYVPGLPITTFCDHKLLTIKERLGLFRKVCKAVQHAHQKGIIHRDLKPSNVLVSMVDNEPVPKVIDFGLAKATGGSLTDQSLHTHFGQVIGTLQYMSPEQAGINQTDVDTRSDIYSLGAILYELLVGSPPFEKDAVHAKALDEIVRMIREDDPPTLKQRLESSQTNADIAGRRSIDVERMKRLIRGDLEWIVTKSLEKDRSRRYQTADGFSEDIGRYLSDEVVQARSPSTGYRVQRFVKRNQGLVTGVTAFMLLLIAGIAATSWAMFDARAAKSLAEDREVGMEKEKIKADEALQRAERITQTLMSMLRSPDPGKEGKDFRVVDALDQAVVDIRRNEQDPLVKAALLNAIGVTYVNLGMSEESHQLFRECWEIHVELDGKASPASLTARNNIAYSLDKESSDEAARIFEEVLSLSKQNAAQVGTEFRSIVMRNQISCLTLSSEGLEDSRARYDEIIRLQADELGPNHPELALTEFEKELASLMVNMDAFSPMLGDEVNLAKVTETLSLFERLDALHQKLITVRSEFGSRRMLLCGAADNSLVPQVYSRTLQKLGEVYQLISDVGGGMSKLTPEQEKMPLYAFLEMQRGLMEFTTKQDEIQDLELQSIELLIEFELAPKQILEKIDEIDRAELDYANRSMLDFSRGIVYLRLGRFDEAVPLIEQENQPPHVAENTIDRAWEIANAYSTGESPESAERAERWYLAILDFKQKSGAPAADIISTLTVLCELYYDTDQSRKLAQTCNSGIELIIDNQEFNAEGRLSERAWMDFVDYWLLLLDSSENNADAAIPLAEYYTQIGKLWKTLFEKRDERGVEYVDTHVMDVPPAQILEFTNGIDRENLTEEERLRLDFFRGRVFLRLKRFEEAKPLIESFASDIDPATFVSEETIEDAWSISNAIWEIGLKEFFASNSESPELLENSELWCRAILDYQEKSGASVAGGDRSILSSLGTLGDMYYLTDQPRKLAEICNSGIDLIIDHEEYNKVGRNSDRAWLEFVSWLRVTDDSIIGKEYVARVDEYHARLRELWEIFHQKNDERNIEYLAPLYAAAYSDRLLDPIISKMQDDDELELDTSKNVAIWMVGGLHSFPHILGPSEGITKEEEEAAAKVLKILIPIEQGMVADTNPGAAAWIRRLIAICYCVQDETEKAIPYFRKLPFFFANKHPFDNDKGESLLFASTVDLHFASIYSRYGVLREFDELLAIIAAELESRNLHELGLDDEWVRESLDSIIAVAMYHVYRQDHSAANELFDFLFSANLELGILNRTVLAQIDDASGRRDETQFAPSMLIVHRATSLAKVGRREDALAFLASAKELVLKKEPLVSKQATSLVYVIMAHCDLADFDIASDGAKQLLSLLNENKLDTEIESFARATAALASFRHEGTDKNKVLLISTVQQLEEHLDQFTDYSFKPLELFPNFVEIKQHEDLLWLVEQLESLTHQPEYVGMSEELSGFLAKARQND